MTARVWIWAAAFAVWAAVVVGHSLWVRSVTSGPPAALVSPSAEEVRAACGPSLVGADALDRGNAAPARTLDEIEREWRAAELRAMDDLKDGDRYVVRVTEEANGNRTATWEKDEPTPNRAIEGKLVFGPDGGSAWVWPAAPPGCCAYTEDPGRVLCWPCGEKAAPPPPPDPPCREADGGFVPGMVCLPGPGHLVGTVFRRGAKP